MSYEKTRTALALMNCMIRSGEKHSDKSLAALASARAELDGSTQGLTQDERRILAGSLEAYVDAGRAQPFEVLPIAEKLGLPLSSHITDKAEHYRRGNKRT